MQDQFRLRFEKKYVYARQQGFQLPLLQSTSSRPRKEKMQHTNQLDNHEKPSKRWEPKACK